MDRDPLMIFIYQRFILRIHRKVKKIRNRLSHRAKPHGGQNIVHWTVFLH